jgi:hypothetical protein
MHFKEGINGKFFEQRKEIACSFRIVKNEEMLWNICEKMAGKSKLMSV